MNIFKSDRYFVLFDYLISHGQLLLRSQKAKGHDQNIDIIFFDATYIQVFAYLDGVAIRKTENATGFGYNSVSSYLGHNNNSLFEVETKLGEKYYIAASFFRVYENELEFGETSLGVLQYKGREKQISASL